MNIKKESIERVSSSLRSLRIGLEDIERSKYEDLFSSFGNKHECLVLFNYKSHIKTCLLNAEDVEIFTLRLVSLITRDGREIKILEDEKLNSTRKIEEKISVFSLSKEVKLSQK
jgi:hypothetical protein